MGPIQTLEAPGFWRDRKIQIVNNYPPGLVVKLVAAPFVVKKKNKRGLVSIEQIVTSRKVYW